MLKILVAEDDVSTNKLLCAILKINGYEAIPAFNGEAALDIIDHQHIDLLLCDVMMPKMDGYQFLSAFRRENQVPVIVLSAKEEETDTVLGLELGADDYVIKPFRMRELLARVRAALRRVETLFEPASLLRVGDLVMDRAAHSVQIGEKQANLTALEFDLLEILMATPGRVFSRTELVDRLYESGFTGLESTLNVHIRNLRLKIEPDPAAPRYLETVFGVGYRMNNQERP